MFKIKKIIISICSFLFIIFSFIELIKYLKIDNTLYGVYYLIINLIIIFLLIPCAYNYKRYFSKARISKLIIIIVLGIFNSFLLEKIVLNSMNYIDDSNKYIKSIFIYKDILKAILYFILIVFTVFEFKVERLFSKNISKKKA